MAPAEAEAPSAGARRLADIFDGRLGPTKVSLKSGDAMMTLAGLFSAFVPSKSSNPRDLVVLRCANGAELVVDAARCRDVVFDEKARPAHGGDAAGAASLSVFFANVDGEPFLSAALEDGAGAPADAAAARWRELKGAYGRD